MTKAAETGDQIAAETLGDIYRFSRMPIVAYRWYRVAECYGNQPSSKKEQVRQWLTHEQIIQEDQNAISFAKQHPQTAILPGDSDEVKPGTCRW